MVCCLVEENFWVYERSIGEYVVEGKIFKMSASLREPARFLLTSSSSAIWTVCILLVVDHACLLLCLSSLLNTAVGGALVGQDVSQVDTILVVFELNARVSSSSRDGFEAEGVCSVTGRLEGYESVANGRVSGPLTPTSELVHDCHKFAINC